MFKPFALKIYTAKNIAVYVWYTIPAQNLTYFLYRINNIILYHTITIMYEHSLKWLNHTRNLARQVSTQQ